jgi:hypothetical protein
MYGMNDEEQKSALAEYTRAQKQWTDRRLKESKKLAKNVDADADAFTGDVTPTLRMMS